MDVRPQAHDIIRTWLFSTVLRSRARARHAAVAERGDLRLGARSRSQEDVEVEGQRRHADGAARGARLGRRALLGGERRPGHRHGVRSGQMKVGRRLAIKLLNASKFVLGTPEPAGRRHASARSRAADEPARARRGGDARARRTTTTPACCRAARRSSGRFCDDYLELVKSRRYGDHGAEAAASANAALLCALSVLQRLFAPYLPFVTEEVWSWWQPGSVHRARVAGRRPRSTACSPPDADARRALDAAIEVLGEIRREKSSEKRPLKARIDVAVVRWSEAAIGAPPGGRSGRARRRRRRAVRVLSRARTGCR